MTVYTMTCKFRIQSHAIQYMQYNIHINMYMQCKSSKHAK